MSDHNPENPGPGTISSTPPAVRPTPEPFYQTWIRAVTKPNASNYAGMAAAPNASTATALLWYFLPALVEFFIAAVVVQLGKGAQSQLLQDFGGGGRIPVGGAGSFIFELVCGVPIAAVLALLFFMLCVGVVHLIARAFGGKGTFGQLAYVFAAISAPVAVISTVVVLLEAIPVLGLVVGLCFIPVGIVLYIYAVVLEVIATAGVHQISGGKASVSALALPVFFSVCVACATIAALMVLGPVIGNTFSSINSSLQSVP